MHIDWTCCKTKLLWRLERLQARILRIHDTCRLKHLEAKDLETEASRDSEHPHSE